MKKFMVIFFASILLVNGQSETEKNEIMQKVKQIQAGIIPSDVKAANSSSLTANINGKEVTIKTTIYSTGNEKKGTIQNVKVIYEGKTEIDRSINSIIWDGNKVTKKMIQYSPRSGNNISINSNGGIVSSSSGGNVITSTNGGSTIVQES